MSNSLLRQINKLDPAVEAVQPLTQDEDRELSLRRRLSGASQSELALRQGVENLKSTVPAVVGLAKSITGFDGTADLLESQRMQEEAARNGPRVQELKHVDGIGTGLEYARNLALTQLPNIAGVVATSGTAGLARAGISVVARGAAARAEGARAVTALARQGQAVGGAAAGTAGQIGQIAPQVILDTEGEGTQQERAAKALVGSVATGTLESLPILSLLNRYGARGAREAVTGGLLTRMTKEAAKQGSKESMTELAQTVGERLTHKWVNDSIEWMDDEAIGQYANALVGGFVGGGVFGAPAGIAGGKWREKYTKAKAQVRERLGTNETPAKRVEPGQEIPRDDLASNLQAVRDAEDDSVAFDEFDDAVAQISAAHKDWNFKTDETGALRDPAGPIRRVSNPARLAQLYSPARRQAAEDGNWVDPTSGFNRIEAIGASLYPDGAEGSKEQYAAIGNAILGRGRDTESENAFLAALPDDDIRAKFLLAFDTAELMSRKDARFDTDGARLNSAPSEALGATAPDSDDVDASPREFAYNADTDAGVAVDTEGTFAQQMGADGDVDARQEAAENEGRYLPKATVRASIRPPISAGVMPKGFVEVRPTAPRAGRVERRPLRLDTVLAEVGARAQADGSALGNTTSERLRSVLALAHADLLQDGYRLQLGSLIGQKVRFDEGMRTITKEMAEQVLSERPTPRTRTYAPTAPGARRPNPETPLTRLDNLAREAEAFTGPSAFYRPDVREDAQQQNVATEEAPRGAPSALVPLTKMPSDLRVRFGRDTDVEGSSIALSAEEGGRRVVDPRAKAEAAVRSYDKKLKAIARRMAVATDKTALQAEYDATSAKRERAVARRDKVPTQGRVSVSEAQAEDAGRVDTAALAQEQFEYRQRLVPQMRAEYIRRRNGLNFAIDNDPQNADLLRALDQLDAKLLAIGKYARAADVTGMDRKGNEIFRDIDRDIRSMDRGDEDFSSAAPTSEEVRKAAAVMYSRGDKELLPKAKPARERRKAQAARASANRRGGEFRKDVAEGEAREKAKRERRPDVLLDELTGDVSPKLIDAVNDVVMADGWNRLDTADKVLAFAKASKRVLASLNKRDLSDDADLNTEMLRHELRQMFKPNTTFDWEMLLNELDDAPTTDQYAALTNIVTSADSLVEGDVDESGANLVLKQEQALVNELADKLGMSDIKVVVSTEARNAGYGGSYNSKTRTITINRARIGAARLETLMHEFGHAVFRDKFAASSPATKRAIAREYKAWRRTTRHVDSVGELRASRGPAYLGELARELAGAHQLSARDAKYQRYARSMEEWAADQVAIALLTDRRGRNPVERFFRRVAKALKTAYDGVRGLKPAPSVGAWVDSLFRDRVQQLSGMSKPSGFYTTLSPEQRSILERAFRSNDVYNQIRDYARDTKIDDSGYDLEVLINAGVAAHLDGKLQLAADARGAMRALVEKIRQVFGLSSVDQLATVILHDVRNTGKARDPRKVLRADANALQAAVMTSERFVAKNVKPAFDRFMTGLVQRVRDLNYAGVRRIAVQMNVRTGENTGDESMQAAVNRNRAEYMQQYLDAVKGMSAEDKDALRESLQRDGNTPLWKVEANEVMALLSEEQQANPLVREFVETSTRAGYEEKQSDPKNWTRAEREAYDSGNWKEFSQLRGYTDAEIENFGKYMKAANTLLKKYGEQYVDDIRGAQIEVSESGVKARAIDTAQARALQGVLERVYGYLSSASRMPKGIDNYFPVVMDTREVTERRTEFQALLSQPHFEQPIRQFFTLKSGDPRYDTISPDAPIDELVEIMTKMAEHSSDEAMLGGNTYSLDGVSPGFRGKRKRVSQFIYDHGTDADRSTFASFQSKSLDGIMAGYIGMAVRRAEFDRRFTYYAPGDNGDKEVKRNRVADAIKQMKDEGASKAEVELVQDFVDASMGTYNRRVSPVLLKVFGAIDSAMGTNLSSFTPQQRDRLNAVVTTYQNLRLLTLAGLSSLVDPLGAYVRGGKASDAWRSYKDAVRAIHGSGSELRDMAETMAIIERNSLTEAMAHLYGSGGADVNSLTSKANAALFKFNGLEYITRMSRIAALANAHRFLIRHATAPTAHSERYLRELGLSPTDIRVDADRPQFVLRTDKVDVALRRFVDESVIRPSPSHRPLWQNDPNFAIVAQYRGFLYSLYETVALRMVNEVKRGNPGVLLALVPYIGVTMMAELAREMAQNLGEDPRREKWGAYEYLSLSVERTGLLGPKLLAFDDARTDNTYGSNLMNSMTGPTGQQINQLIDAAVGDRRLSKVAVEALPGSALIEDWGYTPEATESGDPGKAKKEKAPE